MKHTITLNFDINKFEENKENIYTKNNIKVTNISRSDGKITGIVIINQEEKTHQWDKQGKGHLPDFDLCIKKEINIGNFIVVHNETYGEMTLNKNHIIRIYKEKSKTAIDLSINYGCKFEQIIVQESYEEIIERLE